MDKKETKVLVILVIIVIAVIGLIFYLKGRCVILSGNPQEAIKCIGLKAKLAASPTCGHCADQKKILQDYYANYTDYIQILDVTTNPEVIKEYNLRGWPAWIIGNEVHYGTTSICDLKKLTGC
jgi:hypothetical protein